MISATWEDPTEEHRCGPDRHTSGGTRDHPRTTSLPSSSARHPTRAQQPSFGWSVGCAYEPRRNHWPRSLYVRRREGVGRQRGGACHGHFIVKEPRNETLV